MMLNARPRPAVAGAYVAGNFAGSLLTGALLLVLSGLVSWLPERVAAGLLVAAVVALAVRAAGLLDFRLPQNSRQIPAEAFLAPAPRAAFAFAFELGTAMRTYITKEAPYVAALVMILLAPSSLGPAILAMVLLALGFAIGRSLIVSTQIGRRALIVEHPPQALKAANWVTLITAAALGVGVLSGLL